MKRWKRTAEGILLTPSAHVDMNKTLDCGQCFRWRLSEGTWQGIAGQRQALWRETAEGWLLEACSEADFELFWVDYLDLRRDYGEVEALYRGLDPRLDTALELGRGIRLLRQPFWETVVSFVLSANNNIPRIQGMIERLCGVAGPAVGAQGRGFPSAGAVAGLQEEDLRALGFGYRAPYVMKLAQGFAEGRWEETAFRNAPTARARKMLLELPGVGPKVADCILLFSLGRLDAFPVDTWIRKTLEELDRGKAQGERIMDCLQGECRASCIGYVQQVLFFAARYQKWGT